MVHIMSLKIGKAQNFDHHSYILITRLIGVENKNSIFLEKQGEHDSAKH